MNSAFQLSEIDTIAKTLIANLYGGSIVVLVGEMGVGKTTIVKACAKALGVDEEITSPTFSIVEQHDCNVSDSTIKRIIHVDTYRIEFENEIYDIGLEEIFANDALTFIEWGDRIENMIDGEYYIWNIVESADQSRTISIEKRSAN